MDSQQRTIEYSYRVEWLNCRLPHRYRHACSLPVDNGITSDYHTHAPRTPQVRGLSTQASLPGPYVILGPGENPFTCSAARVIPIGMDC